MKRIKRETADAKRTLTAIPGVRTVYTEKALSLSSGEDIPGRGGGAHCL